MFKNKYRLIQILRFLVQLFFMLGLIFAFRPHYHLVGNKIFLTILIVGVFFCGWVCPFGAAQDWLWKVGRFLKLPSFRIPDRLQKYMQLSRYIFYALSTIGISFAVLNARGAFNHRLFEGGLDLVLGCVLGFFLFLALFINRPFCNYFCAKGAYYGILSTLRLFSIRRDNERCAHCKKCDKHCPMNIKVEQTEFVRHPNCINCMTCLSVCPKKCLNFAFEKQSQKAKK